MRILILVFSPSGHTLKIAQMLEKKLISAGNKVQLLDVTRSKEIFKENKIRETLERKVKAHDVICFGSPVYEKHLEYYGGLIIKNLPKPDDKWGSIAVPFFTYGGISSGIAMKQSLRLLKNSGRVVLAAMKIESSHIVTKRLKTRVNEGLPGKEAQPVINELAKRIQSIEKTAELKDFASELNFHTFKEKVLCFLMNEKMLHTKRYPALKVLTEKCTKCGNCSKACPVQRIETQKKVAFMSGTSPMCIHCFSCVNACKFDAITFENNQHDWNRIERILKLVSKKNSFIQSMETPRSAVYPL